MTKYVVGDQSKSSDNQAKYHEIGKLTFREKQRFRYYKATHKTEICLSDSAITHSNHGFPVQC